VKNLKVSLLLVLALLPLASMAEDECPPSDSPKFKNLLYDKVPCNSQIYTVDKDGNLVWLHGLSDKEFYLLMATRTPRMSESEKAMIIFLWKNRDQKEAP
jgi:hypothetical protein